LLKVSVGNKHERAKILNKCTQLYKLTSLSYVFITLDLTKKEQEVNQALRAKLTDMKKSGKN